MKRILAWSEMLVLFVLLYVGIPWAGLTIDGLLRIPPWPSPVRWIGPILLVVGLAGLAWCFALFVRVGRGTPNPSRPPTALVTVGPYRWTRNPIALSHAFASATGPSTQSKYDGSSSSTFSRSRARGASAESAATRKLTSVPGASVTVVPPPAQFPGAGQIVFVIVVVAWSSTLNGNRGVAPSLAGLTRELVMLTEVVADSSGAAPVPGVNPAKLMLARSISVSAADRAGRVRNLLVFKLRPLPLIAGRLLTCAAAGYAISPTSPVHACSVNQTV